MVYHSRMRAVKKSPCKSQQKAVDNSPCDREYGSSFQQWLITTSHVNLNFSPEPNPQQVVLFTTFVMYIVF